MKKQVVLTLSDKNDKLNTIVTKYYKKWKNDNYIDEYNKEYLDYYMAENEINAKTKAELLSKNYVYGYVENIPFESKVNGELAGIAGEYVNRLSRLSGINFTLKKYNSKKALKEAIIKSRQQDKKENVYQEFIDSVDELNEEQPEKFIAGVPSDFGEEQSKKSL